MLFEHFSLLSRRDGNAKRKKHVSLCVDSLDAATENLETATAMARPTTRATITATITATATATATARPTAKATASEMASTFKKKEKPSSY